MEVVLYAKDDADDGDRLVRQMKRVVRSEEMEVHRSLDELAGALRQPTELPPIAVLMAIDRDELLTISSLRAKLGGCRLVLLVPDEAEETLAIAHQLHPRFLSSAHGDFLDLSAVLAKMLSAG